MQLRRFAHVLASREFAFSQPHVSFCVGNELTRQTEATVVASLPVYIEWVSDTRTKSISFVAEAFHGDELGSVCKQYDSYYGSHC